MMVKLFVTILSVAFAVGAFSALWVGTNLVFDQATRSWSRFSALAGGLVGFVFFAIIDGNRALQTIGPRDDVKESLFFGSKDGFTVIGNLVGILWWAIPGALIFGLIGYLLSKSADPKQRLLIGVVGGVGVGLLLGVMLKTLYLPALKVLPMIIWPLASAAAGAAIASARRKPPLPTALTFGAIGWILGTFGVSTLGRGTRAEALMVTAVAGLLVGLRIGLTKLPDQVGRTRVDTKSRAWIFMAPAMFFISATLVVPSIITLVLSVQDNKSNAFVGLDNYVGVFRTNGKWNDGNFDLDNWTWFFTSRLFWIGLGLLIIGLLLAVAQGRRTGRSSEWTPQSGGTFAIGAVLLVFALFSVLRGTVFNNLWWVFAVTVFATGAGLLVATLADGARGEKVAKSLIFMPMAISFVGASIIWRFMYRSQNVKKNQTGVLNAIWAWLGAKTAGASPTSGVAPDYDRQRFTNVGVGIFDFEIFNFPAKNVFGLVFLLIAAFLVYRAIKAYPVHQEAGTVGYLLAAAIPAYLSYRTFAEGIGGYEILANGEVIPRPITFLETGPFNNFWLMIVMLWIETGFAMVILSAAIKAVPAEYIEAAKIDGANDSQIFWRITMPSIAPTIGVVITTIIVRVTKVYDVVKVMTGGNFDTNVLANEMINQSFSFSNFGTGGALAIILFLTVLPVMILNIRRMQKEAANV